MLAFFRRATKAPHEGRMAKGFKSRGNGGSGKSSGGGKGKNEGGGARGEKSSGGGRNDSRGNNNGGSGNGRRKGRDIKNARSLSDVLGGGAGRGTVGGNRGPQREEPSSERQPHPFNREGGSGASGRSSDSGNSSNAPVSKKLQYIMTFTPPEERGWGREEKPREQIPVKAEVSRPVVPTRSRFDVEPEKKNSPSREKFITKQREEPSRGESRPDSRTESRPASRNESRNENRNDKRSTQKQAPSRPQESRSTQKQAPEVSARRAPERTPAGSWPQNRVTAIAPVEQEEARRGRGARTDAKRVSGIIKRHPDGFGFLIPDQPDTPDVYVARQSMTGIMTNDKVEVELYRPRSGGKSKEDRLSGEIIKVISRSNTRVVGRYLPVDKKYGMLQDENRGWGADLRIAADDSMGAKEGELIAVEITQYPDDEHEFTGKVVSVIGDSDDPINDVIRIVHQAGIPNEFSKEASRDAQKFGGEVTAEERRGREDLTKLNLITIDGVTAKDFDDAIYTEQSAKGFRLVVAIADVSHYVKPGSRLDEEAYERGTSTYFPNYVVPMLPEELSNELCSLKPHVLRLCFCCEMNINFDGEIQNYRFFEGVMESKARVTYGEAQEVIDAYANGEERKNKAAIKLASVSENILRSADLAKILMQKRFRDGSLDLEIPETQVVVDASGESTDVIRASRLFAHRLIEELMLVTNICTARFMENAQVAGIYRVHGEPDKDNIANLQRFLWNMGGTKALSGSGHLAKKLTAALESMKGKPEAQILNILTLRTMQQAQYSNINIGHFGLGFTHYSHFTSPIRRYPDLIAHRIIKSQIYDKYHGMQMQDDEVASATTWLSATEQRSTKAERKVISIKKARFIRRFIDQEFEGMISSVAKFGVFVLLRQYDVDGLIKIENLGNDRFEFDEENLRLVGRKSGLQYTIGDVLKVRVMGADTDTGKVDFELAEAPAGAKAKRTNREDEEVESGERPGQRNKPSARKKTQTGKRQVAQPEKRGKGADDRRGVRKERVSKRRGKN